MKVVLGVLVVAVACGPEHSQPGGGGGTGGASGQGGAAGCVDVVLGPGALAAPPNWFGKGDAIRGGLGATSNNIEVAWMAYRPVKQGGTAQFLNDTVPWLVISTLDPTTGEVVSTQPRAIFPAGVKWGDAVLRSVAWRDDGRFALGYGLYLDDGSSPARFRLGHASAPDFEDGTLALPAGVPEVRHTFSAWDGEAFAMHVYGAPPTFGVFVARVDDSGDVVLPLKEYGIASNVPPTIFSHRTSTSAESGRSYSADASGSAFLSGHLRDGTRLPGTESGAKIVKANGQSTEVANSAVVSADAAGAWLMWQQNIDAAGTWGLVAQRVDLDGDAIGSAGIIPIFPFDPEDGIWRWGILSHGDSATIIAASDRSFYRFDYDGKKVSAPLRFVGPGDPYTFDPRDIEVIQAHGDIWVSYSSGVDVRVLKVKDGCHYPAKHGGPEP